MYLSAFEQVTATNVVKTAAALTIPARATHAEIQADTTDVRYTMDDATNPTENSGMIFLVGVVPKSFLIEDVARIRFREGGGANGFLNIHYYGGRDV